MDEKPTKAGSDRRSKRKEFYKPTLANDVILVLKLMGHPDVPTRLKLLPVFAVLYLFWPWDIAFGPVDDALVIWLATTFFIQSCPPHAVKQVKDEIANPAIKINRTYSGTVNEDDVVEGEFRDLDQKQQGPKTPHEEPPGRQNTRRNKPKDPNSL